MVEKTSEAALASKFIGYFNDQHEIFKEVPAGGNIIDFVAVCGNIRIGVEVKNTCSLEVIHQAVEARRYCHYAYIAVPSSRDQRWFARRVCKDYGVGVLTYHANTGTVLEQEFPKLNRKPGKLGLADWMKESVAGSQHERVTAFSNSVNKIVAHLNSKGGSDTMKNVLTNVEYHWTTVSSARSCIRNWCSRGVITQFSCKNGVLTLTQPHT